MLFLYRQDIFIKVNKLTQNNIRVHVFTSLHSTKYHYLSWKNTIYCLPQIYYTLIIIITTSIIIDSLQHYSFNCKFFFYLLYACGNINVVMLWSFGHIWKLSHINIYSKISGKFVEIWYKIYKYVSWYVEWLILVVPFEKINMVITCTLCYGKNNNC